MIDSKEQILSPDSIIWDQKQNEKLFVNLFISVSVIVFLYIPTYWWVGAKVASLALVFGLLVFGPAVLFLKKNKKPLAARSLFVLSCNYYILSTSVGLGHHSTVEFYCLPSVMLGLLLFDPKNYRYVLSTMLFALLTWAHISFKISTESVEQVIPQNLPIENLKKINFLGAFIIMSVFLWIFIRTSRQRRDVEVALLKRAARDIEKSLHDKIKSEDKLKLVIDSMSEGLIVRDSTAKIVLYNSTACKILELTPDQLLGRTPVDFQQKTIREDGSVIPPEALPGMLTLRTGIPTLNSLVGIQIENKRTKWIQVNAIPMEDLDSGRVLITFSDITQQLESNNEVRHIFNQSQDLLCIAGGDGFFKKVNPSFTKILGFSEQDLLERPIIDFIHPDDVSSTLRAMENLSKGVPLVHFENRCLTTKKSYRLLTWMCLPDMKTGLFYASGRDVTELKSIEIRNAEILNVIDKVGIVAFVDRNGTITKVNDNFCKISGFSESELVGQNHKTIHSGIHGEHFFETLWKTVAAGNVWIGNIEDRAKDGSHYHVRVIVTPLKNSNGKIEEFMSLRFDLTEQKRLRSQLVEAQSIAKMGSQDVMELIRSQEENRFVLDALGIGIWKLNPITQELNWDSSMYQLFEINPNISSGLYEIWLGTLNPAAKEAVTKAFGLAQKGEKDFDTIFEITTASGKKKFIGSRAKVSRNGKNEPVLIYGINWDCTKEVMDSKTLERQHKLIDSILNHLPNMVFVKDYQNKLAFTFFNNFGMKLLGVSSDQILGKTDYDFFPKEQADFFVAKDREVFEKRSVQFIEKEPIDTPLGKRWLRTYKVPTYKADGRPDLLIGISTDITSELKMSEELELERLKSIQTAKLASLGEMSAGVAHEINNPLAIISGIVQSLDRFKTDSEKFSAKISSMQNAVDRISKIIKGLQKFSRTSDGSPRDKFVLSEMVNEAITLTEMKAKRNLTTIATEITTHAKILCDQIEIEQVIINLINNGIDATKSLSEKWVKIRIFVMEEDLVLQISDSGKGISKEVQKKLFHPFFTTKPVGEGTGLGLSICKGILEQHGARISFLNQLENTCFEIRFSSFEL